MQIKELYKFVRSDGGIDISPNKLNDDYVFSGYRLIADKGNFVTDGVNLYYCIDIAKEELNNWKECEEVANVNS